MIIFESLLFIIAAYFFGSISSAIIVCKLMRLPDPRTEGSKNPGATNVLRIGGKGPALITLLGDVLKGVIPVLLAKWMGLDPIGLAGVTFAAFLGHLYPVFFEFSGDILITFGGEIMPKILSVAKTAAIRAAPKIKIIAILIKKRKFIIPSALFLLSQ